MPLLRCSIRSPICRADRSALTAGIGPRGHHGAASLPRNGLPGRCRVLMICSRIEGRTAFTERRSGSKGWPGQKSRSRALNRLALNFLDPTTRHHKIFMTLIASSPLRLSAMSPHRLIALMPCRLRRNPAMQNDSRALQSDTHKGIKADMGCKHVRLNDLKVGQKAHGYVRACKICGDYFLGNKEGISCSPGCSKTDWSRKHRDRKKTARALAEIGNKRHP